jgi:hypothetical protein
MAVIAGLHGVMLGYVLAVPLGIVFAFGKAFRDVRRERRQRD